MLFMLEPNDEQLQHSHDLGGLRDLPHARFDNSTKHSQLPKLTPVPELRQLTDGDRWRVPRSSSSKHCKFMNLS